jgi:hypothetical protein
MRRTVLVIAVLLAGFAGPTGPTGPRSAAAQPALTPPAPPPAAPPVAPVAHDDLYSERTALALSLGSTSVSWVLVLIGGLASDDEVGQGMAGLGAIGTFVGPSLGHWYTGSFLTRGLGVRSAGLLSAFAGMLMLIPTFGGGPEHESNREELSAALLLGGAALYIAGTVDDIVGAPRKVRRHNQRLRGVGVGIAPVITPHSTGIALGGRF